MITIGESIQRVQSEYSKGVQSNDTRLTDRHIYRALVNARSTLIRQQANKNQALSDWMYQIIPCVELIQAPIHECVGAPSGMTMLRSKEQIPALITGLSCALFRPVTTLEGGLVIDKGNFMTNKYLKGNKYTALKPFMYWRNRYIYVGGLEILTAIPLEGLYDDPIEVWRYPSLCADGAIACLNNSDLIFPIDNNLEMTMIDMASNECLAIFKQMEEDKQNNAIDDSATSGMLHQPKQ